MCNKDKCPVCKGTGEIDHGIMVRCFSCNGTGIYKEKCKNCKCEPDIEIIINGTPMVIFKEKISFSEIVELALGKILKDVVYTITYEKGHCPSPEGILVDGDILKLKKNMFINVTRIN